MNGQVWWYTARASGIVAWALLTLAVVWGLLLTTRLLGGRPTPKWLLDLHRFLGGIAVVFTGVHVAALVADSYVHFDVLDVLVPFASQWKPVPVALGVVALWLLLAVEGSSLLMRRLPRRWWRTIHLSSYLLFWVATFHTITAGTDAGSPWMFVATNVSIAVVVFLTLVRVLASKPSRRRPRSEPVPERAEVASGGRRS